MQTDIPAELNLPPVNQIGFVVRNLDDALRLYQPLFGEFTVMDAADMVWDYRGKPETSSLKIAFGNSGDVEIELIEWVSGETPHKEFLEAGREGLHHLRFVVDNVDETAAAAATHGYEKIWYKRFSDDLAACYLERCGDPVILELFENRM